MGLHPMVMDRPTAEKYKEQVSRACSSHLPPSLQQQLNAWGGVKKDSWQLGHCKPLSSKRGNCLCRWIHAGRSSRTVRSV
jgi:hypothetical protein